MWESKDRRVRSLTTVVMKVRASLHAFPYVYMCIYIYVVIIIIVVLF